MRMTAVVIVQRGSCYAQVERAELEMLRLSLGVTVMDTIRNEYIRGTVHVGWFGEKTREARLKWFGHVPTEEGSRVYWKEGC